MRKSVAVAVVFGLALSFGAAVVVLAHSGEGEAGIVVEPSSVTAGDTVVLAGSGLEPDSDRVLVLAGDHLTVALGTVTTDADGMFSTELTIPRHLPSGTYELLAIGDETISTPLVVAAAAGAVAEPDDATDSVVTRKRSPFEFGSILGLAGLAAVFGVLLIWRAERFRGTTGG